MSHYTLSRAGKKCGLDHVYVFNPIGAVLAQVSGPDFSLFAISIDHIIPLSCRDFSLGLCIVFHYHLPRSYYTL